MMRYEDIPKFKRVGDWECDYTFSFFINSIERMIEEEGLELNPDFQRGHLWTEEQQIAYIEFILKGGKTSRVIYLNNPNWGSWSSKDMIKYDDFVCVDGLQRITAVQRFVKNEIKVFGHYYSEYDNKTKRQTFLKINVNSLPSKKDVLQWYIEMNSGGIIHSIDEIERVKKMLEDIKE